MMCHHRRRSRRALRLRRRENGFKCCQTLAAALIIARVRVAKWSAQAVRTARGDADTQTPPVTAFVVRDTHELCGSQTPLCEGKRRGRHHALIVAVCGRELTTV